MRAAEIAGSRVAVLGGTAGVGFETAAQFASGGASVAILGRNAERGHLARTRVLERCDGAEIVFVMVDAAEAADAARAALDVEAALGGIDTLVCTTGPSHPPQLLHTIPADSLAPRIDEILRPPLHMIHAVLPLLRKQGGGSIVAVASDAAKTATPGETLVGAAMAAIVMFCRAAALEEKRNGIRINLLTPSLSANTPGAALIDSDPFAAKLFEKATSMAKLGVAEPEDLAAMAVYLASPAARRITGQAISINGGISVA